MTTTNILLAEEPAIFDTVNKTLSAGWVDWYLVKNNTDAGEAIKVGNELIANMIRLFPLVTEPANELLKKQLLELQADMQAYVHVFSVLGDINENGWYPQVMPGDPSIFATSGPSADLRAWVVSLAAERKIPRTSINVFIQVIAASLASMDLSNYDLNQPTPPVQSVVEGVPSMHWVIDYAGRNKIALVDAHDVGVSELQGPTTLEA